MDCEDTAITKSTDKREITLLKKYGKEGLAAKRREWQAKSRKKYKGTGGLRAMTPERLKEITSAGGKARAAQRKLQKLEEEKRKAEEEKNGLEN